MPAAAFGGHFLDPDGVTMNSTTPGAGGRPAGRSCVQRAGERATANGDRAGTKWDRGLVRHEQSPGRVFFSNNDVTVNCI